MAVSTPQDAPDSACPLYWTLRTSGDRAHVPKRNVSYVGKVFEGLHAAVQTIAMKLICFPFAGGGSLAYRNWGRDLGVDVIAAALPAREARHADPMPTSMAPLVADLATRLAEATRGPYMLFGHSMGANVAFALARELERRGTVGPRCLILSGCSSPHLPPRFAPIHGLPEPELIKELRDYGGTPQAVLDEPELLAYFLPMLRADLAVNETYAVTAIETVATPIVAIGGSNDAYVTHDELTAWAALTTRGCETHVIEGGHFFIQDQRAELLALVRDAIARHR